MSRFLTVHGAPFAGVEFSAGVGQQLVEAFVAPVRVVVRVTGVGTGQAKAEFATALGHTLRQRVRADGQAQRGCGARCQQVEAIMLLIEVPKMASSSSVKIGEGTAINTSTRRPSTWSTQPRMVPATMPSRPPIRNASRPRPPPAQPGQARCA